MIVGLGNPGTKYEYTRHNLGFLTLDRFVSNLPVSWNKKHDGLFCQLSIDGLKRTFIKPQSFMNLSGEVVQAFVRNQNIEPFEILVIHDEADLSPGIIRLKRDGGAGGHNGLRSMIDRLGTRDFCRMRVGTGKHAQMDLAAFLLSKTTPDVLDPMAESASQALQDVVSMGFVQAQRRLHQETSI